MPSVRDLLLQLCVLGVSTGLTAASNPLAAMGPDGSTGRASASSAAAAEPGIKRYLVAYASSITNAPRTASAITLVNDAGADCAVTVDFFTGFGPTTPVCSLTAVIPGGFAYDFCTRDLPVNITTCNATCATPLTYFEGKAVISTGGSPACQKLAVNARQYYTTGTTGDTGVAGVNSVTVVKP